MEQGYLEPSLLQEHATERKAWNIGTYSMGLTLIGIGFSFFASLWQATTAYELLLWLAPIVFVVLGIEMLVAHSPRFIERYRVRYNWLAVLFVAFIGSGALVLSAFLSTGLLSEVSGAFNTKERQVYIDETEVLTSNSIDKIIIKSDFYYDLQQQAEINDITLLGTISYHSEKPVLLSEQKLLETKQVGNVLYVFIQKLEYEENKLNSRGINSNLILIVPDGIVVE